MTIKSIIHDHHWKAWIRLPRGRWRVVGTAATEREAGFLALKAAEDHKICDQLVTRSDVDANKKKKSP